MELPARVVIERVGKYWVNVTAPDGFSYRTPRKWYAHMGVQPRKGMVCGLTQPFGLAVLLKAK